MTTKNWLTFSVFLICICFPIAVKSAPALLVVNNSTDSHDAVPGDGSCSDTVGYCTLRAAVEESNASPGNVIIFDLPHPAVVDLTLGEIQILSSMNIVGPGARLLTVQRSSAPGTPNFRIFHVLVGERRSFGAQQLTIRNGSDQLGGGIYVESNSTAQMFDMAFTNNTAGSGGALAVSGTAWVVKSLLNSNTAAESGGAIVNTNSSANLYINATTITGNSAPTGGAIDNYGPLTLVNDTVSRNTSSVLCTGIFSRSTGSVTVLNTIIGGDSSLAAMTIQGAFQSAGNNLITDARGSSGFTNDISGDQVSDSDTIDPKLASLANNGGQTDTMALLSGSPAVDHGNNCVVLLPACTSVPRVAVRTPNDQRNYHRSLFGGIVDIGAYEAGASNLTGTTSFTAAGFPPKPGRGSSIGILTNATSLEKRYSFVNAFGSVGFKNLASGPVYILEIRSKQAARSSITVLPF